MFRLAAALAFPSASVPAPAAIPTCKVPFEMETGVNVMRYTEVDTAVTVSDFPQPDAAPDRVKDAAVTVLVSLNASSNVAVTTIGASPLDDVGLLVSVGTGPVASTVNVSSDDCRFPTFDAFSAPAAFTRIESVPLTTDPGTSRTVY